MFSFFTYILFDINGIHEKGKLQAMADFDQQANKYYEAQQENDQKGI